MAHTTPVVSGARHPAVGSAASTIKKLPGRGLFAPTLAKAKAVTRSLVKDPVKAVVTAAAKTPVKTSDDADVTGKESEISPGNVSHRKTVVDQSESTDVAESAEAATKPPVPTAATAAAVEQSAAVVRKPVKGQKPALVKTPVSDGASHAVESATARTNTDESHGDVTGLDDQIDTGGGFYGSGKVIARGRTGDATDDASGSATDAASSANGEDATAGTAVTEQGAEATAQADAEAGVGIDASVEKAEAASGGKASTAAVLNALDAQSGSTAVARSIAGGRSEAATPQASFVDENHPKIVSGISGQLLPRGGTMQIRLDPPELGALQVSVHMKDGVMSASFQTSNEEATKLLTRSLGTLKSGLEAAGMSVEKLQVEQAPKQEGQKDSSGNSDSRQGLQDQQQQAQQDQQRREMVQRMWRKLAGGDPLDLVA